MRLVNLHIASLFAGMMVFWPLNAWSLHKQSTVALPVKYDFEALQERLSNSNTTDGNFEALRERLNVRSNADRRRRAISCLRCDRPRYPEEALDEGAEGSPVVTITFDESGNATGVDLESSSGNVALDQAALEAAQQYVFDTGGSNGTVSVEMDFVIEGRNEPTPDEPAPAVPSE